MDMKKMKVSKIIIIVIVVLLMVFSIYPLIYLVLQSLAPWGEVDQKLIPSQLTLRSYVQLFTSSGSQNSFTWIRALLNSFFVCIVTTAVSIATGLLVGFSLTKLSGFKGKKIVMNTLLFQMFFPVVMLLVPRYVIMKNFTNTYTGMLLPMIVSTWAVFMYINYFRTLPDAVFEAAKIDGAGAFKTLWYIALPSTKSITTIVALTVFMGRWNELMWDMIISPNERYQTLNVILSTKINMLVQQQGVLYAASVLLILPIVILFLIFSRYFKEGINFMLK
jgi:multiple sugar transport system permease protein